MAELSSEVASAFVHLTNLSSPASLTRLPLKVSDGPELHSARHWFKKQECSWSRPWKGTPATEAAAATGRAIGNRAVATAGKVGSNSRHPGGPRACRAQGGGQRLPCVGRAGQRGKVGLCRTMPQRPAHSQGRPHSSQQAREARLGATARDLASSAFPPT